MSKTPEYSGDLTIAFHVKDRKAAIAWYQEQLGFKLLYDLEDMGWCEMASPVEGGKVSVGFSEVEDPKIGGPVPTFGVVDLDGARSRMEKAGVRFDDTVTIPDMVKLAAFYDPDGNTLMFSQTLRKTG